MVNGVLGTNGRIYLLNSLYQDNLRRLLIGPSHHHRGTSLVSETPRLCKLCRNELDSSSYSSLSEEHDEASSSWEYTGDVVRDGTGVFEALEHTEVVDWLYDGG